ncbi:MAG: family 78 glycoside hydrolase catalytic domain [Vicinamibacteria bacterium]
MHPVLRSRSLLLLAGAALACGLFASPARAAAPPLAARATELRCEYRKDPLGLDVAAPRLAWQLRSDARGAVQSAYQVQVAKDEAALAGGRTLWDSGRVASPQSVHVAYAGPALESSRRYYWRVRVWDGRGAATPWSAPAWFETALLAPSDWKARWIEPSFNEDLKKSQPAPMLRGTFAVKGRVRSARAYVTSHGLYELEINGHRVGDQLFTPGWTSYGKRLQYQTYDVTPLLRSGDNAIGARLGDGWYRGYLAWRDRRNVFGDRLGLLCQLRIEYADGRVETVGTDEKWKATTGPILASDLYMGETYDARLEKPGWSAPGYKDEGWTPVRVVGETPKHVLVSPAGPPVRAIEEVKPVKILRTPAGETVFDMGQNMVGHVRIRVSGPAGTTVVLRHAEVLDKDGNFYTANLRAARQEVAYTLKGGGAETYAPHFSFQGFRYVAVAGWPGEPTLDALTGVVVHSDMAVTGTFETSNPLLNQLQHNIRWGQKGNFLDVPTDCPQRDERLGWTGDAQVFSRTASFNMDVAGFFTKWLADVAADQNAKGSVPHVVPNVLSRSDVSGQDEAAFPGGSAAWADVATIVPWNMYLAYGDRQLLQRQYPSMKAWVEYQRREAGDSNLWRTGFHFGDWLAYATTASDYPGATTGKDLIASAFYAHSTDLLQKTAEVLGKKDDAAFYGALLPKIKEAFLREYVTAAGRVGENTQTAYAVALQFDLLPEAMRAEAARRLAAEVRTRGHLTTGFVGTPYLCHVLSRFGYTDVAYMLLNRDKYPSWLYPVKQGATTIWERWDGQKPDGTFQDAGMNSFNHYAYGAIGEWMYRVVAGLEIDPAEPAYRHVLVQPQPGGGLTSAKATLATLYGETASGWSIADGKVTVFATVPPNAHGTVRLPAATLDAVTESGAAVAKAEGVAKAAQDGEDVVVDVGSGRYAFTYDAAKLAARLKPKGRLDTKSPIEALLASPGARAVLDKRVPGFTTDARVQQALKMSLQQVAPYAPEVFTAALLATLDEELAAVQ